MLVQRGKRRYDNARKIENNVPQYREVHPCFMRHQPERRLNGMTKREQYQHVDDQVRPIGVKKTVRNDPVPFLPVVSLIGIEQQTVKQRPVRKRSDGYYRRDDNDDKCH